LAQFSFADKKWQIKIIKHINKQELSLVSPKISDGQTTETSLSFYNIKPGTLAFEYNVSSQLNHDFFKVYLDDSLVLKTSGSTNWRFEQINVTKGLHTLKFIYEKDEQGSFGRDNVLINKIFLPSNSLQFIYDTQNTVKIYPNPATDVILITLSQGNSAKIKIIDNSGRIILSKNITSTNYLNIQELKPGVYTIQIQISDKIFSQKLIKL
jgi:hypothetical protein